MDKKRFLEDLFKEVKKTIKRDLANLHEPLINNLNYIKLLLESKLERSNYWLISIMLDKNNSGLQKDIVRFFNDKKYYIRPICKPLHQNKHLQKFPKMNLKNTNSICKRIINLPSSPSLTR